MNENILVADDENDIRESLSYILASEGYNCTPAENGEDALIKLENSNFDMLITDIVMPKLDGMTLMEKCAQLSPQTIVVLMTAYASIDTAVNALRKGASDYLLKPLEFDEVLVRIRQLLKNKKLSLENKLLREQIDKKYNFYNIIGQSEAMKEVYAMVKQISRAPTNILISGPSGTGKELIARAIHENSNRSDNSFIPVNCGAIPENLYESEFFGYKKGAFTGASADHDGLFKAASGGTLFLDEIAELPENMQVKLLRAIQEKEIRPVGSSASFKVNVRVVAATNKDLLKEISEGRFREDLYYRLNVVEIKLPSLSQRKEDIPLLVSYFIERYNEELKRNVKGVDNEVMKRLLKYEWRGNIRELENMIERAVLLCGSDLITEKELPAYVKEDAKGDEVSTQNLNEALHNYERRHITSILKQTGWNRSETARILGIDTSTLYRKMVKLSIEEPE